MLKEEYRILTVRDIVKIIADNKDFFEDGLDTPVFTGDFEGNYHHILHELMTDEYDKKKALFLGYEMHENDGSK